VVAAAAAVTARVRRKLAEASRAAATGRVQRRSTSSVPITTIRPGERSTGAVCVIDARHARELAFEPLTLAEAAEQWEQAR